MSRRILLTLLIAVLIVVPAGYILYGYSQYDQVVSVPQNASTATYIVINLPDGSFLSLTPQEYANLTLHGFKPPAGSKGYLINVTGTLTGIPPVDVNLTMLAPYKRFTIVVGSPSVKVCSSNPDEFVGSCSERTAAVTEISALTSTLFKRYYYWQGIKQGMDNASAKQYAYEQTMKRYDVRYLSFMTKADIGLGRIGNKDHLVVILLGPAEGATKNVIFVPRRGTIVLEGRSDSALRAEAALIEHILQFKWPQETTKK